MDMYTRFTVSPIPRVANKHREALDEPWTNNPTRKRSNNIMLNKYNTHNKRNHGTTRVPRDLLLRVRKHL